jgi:hypothetical protein
MTASHVDVRAGVSRLAAVVLAFALTSGAFAQQPPPPATPPVVAPPLKLAPPTFLKPLPRQQPEAGVETAPPPASTSPSSSESLIQVDTLYSVDPDSAGTLSETDGGFGAGMWEGTRRNVVESLLPRLPVNTASPAMRDLMRRLLLSNAASPRGDSRMGGLIALRAQLLAAMGDLDDVKGLIAVVPQRGGNEGLARVEANAHFLANDFARACALAVEQIADHDSPFWQKAFNFCQALDGDHDKAALGAAMLQELGEDDPVFFALMDAFTGSRLPILESLPEPTPLHLAMARAAKVALPLDVIASSRPAVLGTIAVSPYIAIDLRLDTAERAHAAKALHVDRLRELYTSIPFSAEELANPLSAAEARTGPFSRALLFRAAVAEAVPTARAEVLLRALELARDGGLYASTVRAFMPVLENIPPSTEQVWFAPEAVRAFLVIGEYERARSWFALLRTSAMFAPESADALAAVLPLARLAGSPEAESWNPNDLATWWERNRESDRIRDRAEMLFSLFDGLGEPIPDGLWEMLLDGPERATVAMPRAALWFRLQTAAAASRTGETVLLSLLALGEGGPTQADPVVMRQVLIGLRGVGLEKDARLLAVEAAVAAGL